MEALKGALYQNRHACRLCDSALDIVVPLAPLTVASPNVGATARSEETAAADLCQCPACGFLQLPTLVDPEFQYRGFRYVTGISVGLREHFKGLIDGLATAGEIGVKKFVLDIGSNDGSLLVLAREHGARILGIDPAERIAQDATKAGIPTIADFFSAKKATAMEAEHGKADVIISNNTVANLDDMKDFMQGIDTLLAPNGLLIIETQYALEMVQKFLLDVIYHEHVSYFSVKPFATFLRARGMELVDAERIAPKGGSIRFSIQRSGGPRKVNARVATLIAEEEAFGLFDTRAFAPFNARVKETADAIRTRLQESRARTGRALAFGSSVGCAALIQYFDLADSIDAIFDDTPLTNSVRTKGREIPVLTGTQLENEPTGDVLVLSWRYIHNIAQKQTAYLERGGRFYRAIPDLTFIGKDDITNSSEPLKKAG